MPDYWFDTDTFVNPSRGAYQFNILPQYWEFIEQKAKEKVILSSTMVLNELIGNRNPDALELWAKSQNSNGNLFVTPDEEVQGRYRRIIALVNNHPPYKIQYITKFLDGADPWIIAHCATYGGRIVTFETSCPNSTKPKIPDVADMIDVKCINLWQMLAELKVKF
jgi:hypothetical protein